MPHGFAVKLRAGCGDCNLGLVAFRILLGYSKINPRYSDQNQACFPELSRWRFGPFLSAPIQIMHPIQTTAQGVTSSQELLIATWVGNVLLLNYMTLFYFDEAPNCNMLLPNCPIKIMYEGSDYVPTYILTIFLETFLARPPVSRCRG